MRMDIKKAVSVKSLGELLEATDLEEEKVRMSINLPYFEGTGESLRPILRSHKKILFLNCKHFAETPLQTERLSGCTR